MSTSPKDAACFRSGTYRRRHNGLVVETVRLDVDGRYPQMTLSGMRRLSLTSRVHWIAKLKEDGNDSWTGSIWYKDGGFNSFPFTQVAASVQPMEAAPLLSVHFSGSEFPAEDFTYELLSPFFRHVEFEYDEVENTGAVLSIGTHDHKDRPATLPREDLSIGTVFERAGFAVTETSGGQIPLTEAGQNATWSDAEMHDAMQTYWSRFDKRAQWSMWVLFAALHDKGRGLGGIMFDDIGPNHRQGTAIFNDSFISKAPKGDKQADAWVRRMRYWTACHEMGHALHLLHSWQKSLGVGWIPLKNQPEARSFMNYPFKVWGGQRTFFGDFAYRFSDDELLFMRHAPERFVQMGNADWLDHHGFEQRDALHEASLTLSIRVNRGRASFEYMEPINIELKLKNVSEQPQLVEESGLEERVVLTIKKRGRSARQWVPFAQRCYERRLIALQPGEAVYGSVLASAGLNGWDIADPGVYVMQAGMQQNGEPVVSDALEIRVEPPTVRDEEVLAQDYFSEDVGRALAFGGTRVLRSAEATLETLVGEFAERRAAIHARTLLANVDMRDYKLLDRPDEGANAAMEGFGGRCLNVQRADRGKAMERCAGVLGEMEIAAESLGHLGLRRFVTHMYEWGDEGTRERVAEYGHTLYETFEKRGVLPQVLDEIREELKLNGRGGNSGRRQARRRKA